MSTLALPFKAINW